MWREKEARLRHSKFGVDSFIRPGLVDARAETEMVSSGPEEIH